MKRILLAVYCILIALSGCSQDESEQLTEDAVNPALFQPFPEKWLQEQHQFQSLSRDGVIRAENHGAPLHSQQIIAELDLVIGRDRGPEEYILYSPTGILIDGNNRILVPDYKRRSILVYDSGGNYIRSIGRQGEGPGEFISFPRLHLWRNGVLDAMVNNGRWQRWTIIGELEFDRRPLDISSSLSTSRYPAISGTYSIIFKDPWYGSAQRDTSSGWWVYHKNALSREPHQVITHLRSGGVELVRGMFEGDNLGTIAPYSQEMLIRQSPASGFVLSHADSAIFTCYDQAFNIQLEVVWNQMPEPLTRDEVVEAFNIYNPAPDWGKDQLIRWIKSLKWHETKPVIADILIGTDERVWVELWDNEPWANRLQSIRERSQFRYLVFTPTGEMEMAIVLPFQLKAASETHLYQLVNDGESTPQVKRYKWRLEDSESPN